MQPNNHTKEATGVNTNKMRKANDLVSITTDIFASLAGKGNS